MVLVSESPDLLHIYDPASNSDQTVSLPDTPLNLSLSPDGLHAAVAHNASISYVDLQSVSLAKSFSFAVGTGRVVLSSEYVYVMPSYEGSPTAISLATGEAVTNPGFEYSSGGRLNPAVNAIYTTQDGLSPNNLNRFSIVGSTLSNEIMGPYHGDYSICGDDWFSPDGARIYNACGNVFNSSSDPAKDMTFLANFPGLANIQSLASSDVIQRLAAVPAVMPYATVPQSDGEIRLYQSNYLNPVGRFVLPSFLVNGKSYAPHGKWVFFNNAGSALYALVEADSTSGLLNDFALDKIAIANPVSCAATFASSSAAAPGSGSPQSVGISAGTDCTYTATSNVPWIQLASGYYGSGNNVLSYVVRPNPSSQPRSGTISLGDQTFTVNQTPAPQPAASLILGVPVVAADYSKGLDKLVFVAGTPNELHVYDPVSQADQVVPLPAIPFSVSVRPDGLYAAVGHAGWISYVNLQSLTVERVLPVSTIAKNLVLAGNGYVYVFPGSAFENVLSVQLSNGQVTATGDQFGATIPRLHASGKFLYASGFFGSDWNIANGPAAVFNTALPPSYSDCGNIWLSKDGERIFTACGSVYRSSADPGVDFMPNGTFSANTGASWVADSVQQQEIAVLTSKSLLGAGDETHLQFYGNAALSLISDGPVPPITANGTTYNGNGRYLFWSSSETRLIGVVEAELAAGLPTPDAVFLASPPSPVSNCSSSLSANAASVGPSGGDFNITLTINAGCTWTAASNASWLNISSASSGSGSGTIKIAIEPNSTSTPRTASLTVAGQSLSVTEAAAGGCVFVMNPAYAIVTYGGGSGSFAVSGPPSCSWTAVSSASWLTITGNASGTGNGIVSYTIPSYQGNYSRLATISIGGQPFTIKQTGVDAPPNALQFVSVTPCRVADTRNSNGPFGGPHLNGGTSRDFVIPSSACNIPATAEAYALNITAVPKRALSYLTAWPSGQPQPNVSILNSYDGRVKAASAIIPAGIDNKGVSLFATNDTDVIIDVSGYFTPPPISNSTALMFYPLAPCRIADTRQSGGALGGSALAAGESRAFAIQSSACGIPATAQAYSLNLTAVPQGPVAYMTAWPTGQPQPFVSVLNAPTGTVTANQAIIPAGMNGDVSLFTTNKTDVVIDINGYFAASGSAGGSYYYPTIPCRSLDTRLPAGATPTSGILDVNLNAGVCNINSYASAFALNATVVPPGPMSYLTLWSIAQPQPIASNLNAPDGAVTSNLAIVPAQNAQIQAFTPAPTYLILDLFGYFSIYY